MKRVLPVLLAVLFLASAAFAAPSQCGESLSDTYVTMGESSATFAINVTAPPTCTYSIFSDKIWMTPISGSTATGNSTVTIQVSTNNEMWWGRLGSITIGGKSVTVNQGAAKGGALARREQLDFNGERVSDYVVIENTGGRMTWWGYRNHVVTGPSTNAFAFGLFNEDVPVPNDFDHDRRTDFAVWRGGPGPITQAYFYILESTTGTLRSVPWGLSGDDPTITQDFDGDLKADPAVTRKENGKLVWYVLLSATNRFWGQQFGNATDKPIRGDYDGDYHADLAVYRPNTDTPANTFFFLRSSNDTLGGKTFGLSDIDLVVPGDYDGNDVTDFAVWRTTNGDWYWMSNPGNAFTAFHWGQPGDLPVPGEYNDNLTTDYCVWRPSNGTFYTQHIGGFPLTPTVQWGNSTFKVPGYIMQVK